MNLFEEAWGKLRENAHAAGFAARRAQGRQELDVKSFDSSAPQFEASELLDFSIRQFILEIADDDALLFEEIDLQELCFEYSDNQGLRLTHRLQDALDTEIFRQS